MTPDFTLEPADVEPDRPERHTPPRMVSTGLAPTTEVPTARGKAKEAPPAYTPCEVCGQPVLLGETRAGQRLALDVHVMTCAVSWDKKHAPAMARPEPRLSGARVWGGDGGGGGSMIPPLLCGHCGICAVPTLGPGAGQHGARALCSNPDCRRFIKWVPKVLPEKESRPMGGIARCTIVGCIGKYGVEVRYATSGAPCASFTLVVSERGQDGKVHDLYVPCECWGKKAEAAGELEAGQLCLFEGRLAKRKKAEQWEMVVSGLDLTPILAPQASLTGTAN
jgi:hypothetical protein